MLSETFKKVLQGLYPLWPTPLWPKVGHFTFVANFFSEKNIIGQKRKVANFFFQVGKFCFSNFLEIENVSTGSVSLLSVS